MSKWKRWVLPSLCIMLGLFFIGAVVWGVLQTNEKESYIRRVQSVYDSAFGQMCNGVSNLEDKLSKLLVASGTSMGQTNLLLMDAWHEAGGTEHMMSELPVSQAATAGLTRFINQVGDYCYMLARKISMGGSMDQNDVNQLATLTDECKKISTELDDIRASGGLQWALTSNEYYALSADGPHAAGQLEKTVEDYPTLLYDGPFSDSSENKKPKLMPENDVSLDEAKTIALNAIRTPGTTLTKSDELEGTVPCWSLQGTLGDGRRVEISVTKKGGYVMMMTVQSSDTQGSTTPSDEVLDDLGKKAVAYLDSIGYKSMSPSFSQYYDGLVVVSCVYTENDVLIYPDMVKVWFDLQSGLPAGVEAHGYIYNHTSRTFSAPKVTQDMAIGDLGTRMQIEGVRLAVIPTPGLKEKLCYEVLGIRDEEMYMVYIDAETGVEEQIFRILNTDEGKLAM
ncbi:MAG: germination protein YpeB [Bacillota bacterium]|nr:germination protein YpeB [Bacillota bacterium]